MAREDMRRRFSVLLARDEDEMAALLTEALTIIDEGGYEDERIDVVLRSMQSCRRRSRCIMASRETLYEPYNIILSREVMQRCQMSG